MSVNARNNSAFLPFWMGIMDTIALALVLTVDTQRSTNTISSLMSHSKYKSSASRINQWK